MAGLDAKTLGDLILFDTGQEPVLVGDRVVQGNTRHFCDPMVIPRDFRPLADRPKPKVRCGRCQLLVGPDIATYYKWQDGWICHACKNPLEES